MNIELFTQINSTPQTAAIYQPPAPLKSGRKTPNTHSEPVNSIQPMRFDQVLSRVQDELRSPSLTEILRGAKLKQGHRGQSVQEIKDLLQRLDYTVKPGDQYDRDLAQVVGQFQEDHQLASRHSPHWGVVGQSTLSALQAESKQEDYNPPLGSKLVHVAKRNASGGRSHCYRYVAQAIHQTTEPFLKGMHAYMAADHLAKSKFFREVEVSAADLPNLPPGAVVVWGKGRSRSGHISIADGHGNEVSDHIGRQMVRHYGGAGHRTFLPIEPQTN